MQIILEGPDGIGKSTISNYLLSIYDLDYIHNLPSDPNTLEFYLEQIKKPNCIMDRSSISELIYSYIYDRDCRMEWDDQIEFLKHFNGYYIICYASNFEDLKTRFEARGDTDLVKKHIQELNAVYKVTAKTLSKMFNNVYDIDISTYNNKEMLINKIESIIGRGELD